MRSLIDTDIFSEIFKRRDQAVLQRANAYQMQHRRFSITVVTAMEITAGLHRVQATTKIARFEALLDNCEVVPLDEEAAVLAGKITAALQRRGTPNQGNDIMIAAIAITEQTTLVTGNTAHFQAIQDAGFLLQIDNWREPN
jgi:tRNA(fMet)-specific endonuclease VapC